MNTPDNGSVTSNKAQSTSRIPTTNSKNLPDSFMVSVIMESRPTQNKWVDEVWDAAGLVAFSDVAHAGNEADEGINEKSTQAAKRETKLIEQDGVKQLIYSGLRIRLFLDECESY